MITFILNINLYTLIHIFLYKKQLFPSFNYSLMNVVYEFKINTLICSVGDATLRDYYN